MNTVRRFCLFALSLSSKKYARRGLDGWGPDRPEGVNLVRAEAAAISIGGCGSGHPHPSTPRRGNTRTPAIWPGFVALRPRVVFCLVSLGRGIVRVGRSIVELSVLVQQTASNRFRAWCGVPVPAEAEGTTRDEALANLQSEIGSKMRGAEVARLFIGRPPPSTAIWPDDEFTRDWLASIAAVRAAADQQPDPWDAP